MHKKAPWPLRGRCATPRLIRCLALVAAAGLTMPAHAATYVWTGTTLDPDTAYDWTDATNWGGAGAPITAADVARFNSPAPANQPTLNSSESISAILFFGTGYHIQDSNSATLTLFGTPVGTPIYAIYAPNVTSGTETIDPTINISNAGPTVYNTQEIQVGDGGTVVFNGSVNTAAGLTLNLVAGTTNLTGTMMFNNANSFGGAVSFGNGGTFSMKGATTFGGLTTMGAAFSATGPTVTLGGADTFNGVLLLNVGTLNLTATNTYNQYVVQNAGTINVTGQGTLNDTVSANFGSSASDIYIGGAGSGTIPVINIDNRTAAGGNLNGRLGGTSITMSGNTITYQGTDASGGSSTDSITSLTIDSINSQYLGATTMYPGAGNSTLTVNNNATAATLSIASLNWVDGSGTFLINGANLGATGGAQILLATPPTLSGSNSTTGVSQQIVPFLVGEASATGGTATGIANTFITYNGATGSLRPLIPASEFTNNAIAAGTNTYITSNTSVPSSNNINSLVINGGDLSIADGATLTNNSGAILFVTGNSIKPSGTSGTLNLGGNNNVFTVDGGAIADITAPVNVGNGDVTVNGPGILTFSSVNNSYNGTVFVNANNGAGGMRWGDGTSNGGFPSASVTLNAFGQFILNNSTAQNVSSNINFSNSQNSFLYTTNTAPLTISGQLLMQSPNFGAPFIFFMGNSPVNITGNIAQTVTGGSYFYDYSGSPVTFSAATTNVSFGNSFYMVGIPGANPLPSPLAYPAYLSSGTAVPNVTYNMNGSIGSAFTGSVPNTGSPTGYILVTNMNRAGTAALPPVAVFNQNGSINSTAPSGTNSYDGYYSGATVWNVNAPLAIGSNLGLAFGSHLAGTGVSVGIMNVAPNQTVSVAPFSTNNQLGFLLIGYNANGFSADDNNGARGYMRLGAGATINNDGNKSTTYVGYQYNGMLDLTNLNADGSAGTGSTLNSYYQMTINGGGVGVGQAGIVNVYPGSTINLYSNATTPNITNNAGTVEYPTGYSSTLSASLNLSLNSSGTGSLGETSVLNVMGGTVNNANAVDAAHTYAAAINLYGSASNDNHTITAMPTGIVNISNGGAVRTNFIRAETVAWTGTPGDAATFVNFGGFNNNGTFLPGELDFNGSGAQGTFIQYGVAGTYVYAGGATIGTSINNATFAANSVTVTQGLMAAPGKGLASITFASPIGSGYVAPPEVVITDATGFDATAYAVVDTTIGDANYGKITSIVVTNPGFNMTNPTVKFVGGEGAPPTAGSYTLNFTPTTSSGFQSSGGLTKLASGTLTLVGTYGGTNSTNTALNSLTTAGANAAVALGNIPAVGAGNAGPAVRNNTSTYAGPTVIEAGTLSLATATSTAVTGQTATYPATNNNIPYSSMIVVGDVPANSGAIFNTSGIGAPGGFQLGPNQILAGFGTVLGAGGTAANNGVTIGAATNGNNFGGGNGTNGLPAINANGAGSVIAPGISPALGTAQGNAFGSSTPVTSTLTLHTSGASPLTTTLASSGSYYWKLNLSTGGSGATATPGTATTSDLTGAKWDAVVLDTLAVSATPASPFTIQAVGFGSPSSVTIGGANTQSYSWTIARASDASINANLLANFALNTSGMPAPAVGYGYFLSAQSDPSVPADSDLVVNYAPVPEPTALTLLAPATGAMLLRRRRKAATFQNVA